MELGRFIVTSGEQKVWADDLEATFKLMRQGMALEIWIVKNVRAMPRMMSIGNGARVAVDWIGG